MFIGGDYDRAIGDNQWNREDCWHLLLTSGARANNILLHITRKTGDDIKLCHWVPKGSIFLKIDQNQLSFLFGFYLKKERKKIERKKVRARPLCHPRQPTHEPFRFIGHINASVP